MTLSPGDVARAPNEWKPSSVLTVGPPDTADRDGGVDALTADGAIVRIRPVREGDEVGLSDLHERASDDTLYRRFLSTGHGGLPREVMRLVRPPDADHAVLVAVERDRIIGVASYEALPAGNAVEFSIFIDDTAHDRGIGTLLLEHLAVRARHRGITDLVGEILPSNSPMLRVATNLGQPLRAVRDLGLLEVHLDTSTVDSEAIDRRDLASARHSLTPLLAPRCVAVVGAGRKPGGIGHAVLRAIVDATYTGTVYAINPSADHIAGVPAYPSLGAAPMAPDLIVIAVPAAAVAAVLNDAAEAGVRAAVVLSSGFGEEGSDGRARQAELVRIAGSVASGDCGSGRMGR